MLDLPAGENAVVAIMSYMGYNQEDSLIFNQSAIDRGIFRCDTLKKYHSEIVKNPSTSQDDIFIKPDKNKVTGIKQGNYNKLNEKGFVKEETEIDSGDIIIGKVSPIQPTGDDNKVYKDNSVIFKSNVSGVIDRVHTGVYNKDGYEMYNVRVRMERTPIIGDKFCVKGTSQVLTDNGWIEIQNIDINYHKVITMNSDGYMKYIYPSNKFIFDYDEDFYNYRNKNIHIECTPEHKLYVKSINDNKYNLIKAKNIGGKTFHMKNNVINKYQDVNIILIGHIEYKMNDWLELLGIYLNNNIISNNEKYLLNRLEIIYTCIDNKIIIKSKNILEHLNSLNKKFPEYIWNLSEQQARLFINILLKDFDFYETKYLDIANEITKLALHCGWTGTIEFKNSMYKVQINNNYNEPYININSNEEIISQYKGKVYCIEVPDSHIYYMRETLTSPSVWIGNSNRHGQKGTLGIALPQKDMPFTEEGIIPDLIMNPHAIPSRMTVAQLIECIASKVGAIKGHFIDGTPFNNYNVRQIPDILKKLGYSPYGTETMYCGITGKKMKAEIFIGPTYYIRLKHMTLDKVHCLTMDHEILTNNGWKFYHQLNKYDNVATLKDNKIYYDKPLKLYYYENYKGDMYKIKNNKIDLNCTDNHRMYVSKTLENEYKLIKASNIYGKNYKYKKTGKLNKLNFPGYYFQLNNIEVDMDAWLIFFGVWITKKLKLDNLNTQQVLISTDDKITKKLIYESLLKLGYSFYIENEICYINNYYLNSYLKNILSNQKSYLPNWIWKLSRIQCDKLLKSILLNNINKKYSTPNKKLADDLMKLYLHAGYECNCIKELINNEEHYVLINTTNLLEEKNIEEEIYYFEGPVFCIQVPSEIFYVRRNGKPVWTGNSRSRGPRQALTRQPLEGRSRDGGLKIGEMEKDAMVAHGISQFLKERLMETSDITKVYVCDECGLFASKVIDKDYYVCNACHNYTRISAVVIPYACKLLFQELMSVNVLPRIKTKQNIYGDNI